MADEVIIEEYAATGLRTNIDGKTVPIPRALITTQVLDIATQSAQFNQRTALIRVQSKGTGFWYKVDNDPSATADTDGNCWLPADQFRDIALESTDLKIDTAADA